MGVERVLIRLDGPADAADGATDMSDRAKEENVVRSSKAWLGHAAYHIIPFAVNSEEHRPQFKSMFRSCYNITYSYTVVRSLEDFYQLFFGR